jgi:hypothetical protein
MNSGLRTGELAPVREVEDEGHEGLRVVGMPDPVESHAALHGKERS